MADQTVRQERTATVITMPGVSPGKIDDMALPQHAIDYMAVLNTASTSIATVTSTAQFAMEGFALILAVVGVFGWLEMRRLIKKKAEQRAEAVVEKHIDKHLNSEHIRNKIDAAIDAASQRRAASAVIVVNSSGGGIAPPPPPGGDVS